MFGITRTKKLTRFKSQPKERMKGNTFATTVANIDSLSVIGSSTSDGKADKVGCLCRSNNHSLEECDQVNDTISQGKGSLLCMLVYWAHDEAM